MKKATNILLVLIGIVFIFTNSAKALETQQNIKPLETLSSIMARLPNANFDKQSPAWLEETGLFYKLSGLGISGELYVKLTNIKPALIILQDAKANQDNESQEAADDNKNYPTFDYKTIPEENVSYVDWVRWLPVTPIKYSKFVAKYGKPSKTIIGDDMSKIVHWARYGVSVNLSDDDKYVLMVDYNFTTKEYDAEYKKVFGVDPSKSKNSSTPNKSGIKSNIVKM